MVQQTFIVTNDRERQEMFAKVRASEGYACAGGGLLQVYESCWDEEILQKRLEETQEALPRVTVVGMTQYNAQFMDFEHNDDIAAFSFCFFETECFAPFYFDCEKMSEREAGKRLREKLEGLPEAKGVELFAVGEALCVEDFLEEAAGERDDLVFYGASAGTKA